MKYRLFAAGMAALCSLAGAVACSSSGSTSSSASAATMTGTASAAATTGGSMSSALKQAAAGVTAAETEPTKIPQTIKLPQAPPQGKNIVYLNGGEPSDVNTGDAVAAAAKALGWHVVNESFNPGDLATLQQAATNGLTVHPVGAIEDGFPEAAFSASVLAAYASAHVPIAEVGDVYPTSKPTATTPYFLSNLAAPNYLATGKALADWFVSNSQGHGKLLLESLSAYPILVSFRDGLTSEITKLCPGCSVKVISISIDQAAANDTVSLMTTAAKANPDYKYMFFDSADFASGITSALSGAGITGISIGGNEINQAAAAAVLNGTETVWTGQSGYYAGYTSVDSILRVLENAPTGIAQDELQPYQLLTKANIGNANGYWNAPYDSLAQFEKLWGVPTTACTVACTGPN